MSPRDFFPIFDTENCEPILKLTDDMLVENSIIPYSGNAIKDTFFHRKYRILITSNDNPTARKRLYKLLLCDWGIFFKDTLNEQRIDLTWDNVKNKKYGILGFATRGVFFIFEKGSGHVTNIH